MREPALSLGVLAGAAAAESVLEEFDAIDVFEDAGGGGGGFGFEGGGFDLIA